MADFPQIGYSAPSQDSGGTTKSKATRVAFDGYVQDIPQGVNNIDDTFTFTWKNIKQSEYDVFDNFFRAHNSSSNGVAPFNFTIPGESSARRFRCKEWKRSFGEADLVSLTASFEVAYDGAGGITWTPPDPPEGGNPPPDYVITVAAISDATSLGRSLMQATSAAAAVALLGIASSSVLSVNGQVGAVTVTPASIGAEEAGTAAFLVAGKQDKETGKGLSSNDFTSAEKSKLAGIASGATSNSSDLTLLNRANHTGVQDASTITTDASHRFVTDAQIAQWDAGSGSGFSGSYTDLTNKPVNATVSVDGYMSAADKTKLDGIANGATSNSLDSYLLSRANHTGNQDASTITTDASHRFVTDAFLTSVASLVTGKLQVSSTSFSANLVLNFAAERQLVTVGASGALSITTSNRQVGSELTLRLVGDASDRTLTFESGWEWYVTPPTKITAGKKMLISLTCLGTNATDIVASYKETP